jgi:hypothetical protein
VGRQIAIELLVMAAIGAALAALGPFGSYALPLELRLPFWMGAVIIGYATFRPMLVVGKWLSEAAAIPRLAADLLVLTVGAVPLTFLLGFVLGRIVPNGRALSEGFLIFYAQIWCIGLAIDLFMHRFFVGRRVETAASEAQLPAAAPPQRPRLLERLPAGFGERILCLGMEDHYVRAYGDHGSTLILMRLGDAIAELDGLGGMQVHRSWWVSRDAVKSVEREGRGIRLSLLNGMTIPVARAYVPAVRASGWPEKAAA